MQGKSLRRTVLPSGRNSGRVTVIVFVGRSQSVPSFPLFFVAPMVTASAACTAGSDALVNTGLSAVLVSRHNLACGGVEWGSLGKGLLLLLALRSRLLEQSLPFECGPFACPDTFSVSIDQRQWSVSEDALEFAELADPDCLLLARLELCSGLTTLTSEKSLSVVRLFLLCSSMPWRQNWIHCSKSWRCLSSNRDWL